MKKNLRELLEEYESAKKSQFNFEVKYNTLYIRAEGNDEYCHSYKVVALQEKEFKMYMNLDGFDSDNDDDREEEARSLAENEIILIEEWASYTLGKDLSSEEEQYLELKIADFYLRNLYNPSVTF